MSETPKLKVVMLVGQSELGRIMYHGIADHADVFCVILENKPSTKQFWLRRAKKLGWPTVIGQLLFGVYGKLVKSRSSARADEIRQTLGLNSSAYPEAITKKVDSINDDEAKELVKQLAPDAIVVNGTRILSKSLLASIKAPIVNTHGGITPKYRGVHGGYWALVNRDSKNCGVTVHRVDAGIDTGDVLRQAVIQPTSKDTFYTYPLLQIAAAVPLMKDVLDQIAAGTLESRPGVLPSKLYSHPTIFEYLKWRVTRGVK